MWWGQAEEVGSAELDTDASVARLLKLLRGPLGKGLPRVETCSPSSVALLALTRMPPAFSPAWISLWTQTN
jgi:hypothetical protein